MVNTIGTTLADGQGKFDEARISEGYPASADHASGSGSIRALCDGRKKHRLLVGTD